MSRVRDSRKKWVSDEDNTVVATFWDIDTLDLILHVADRKRMAASLRCNHARTVIAVGRLISNSKVDSQQLFAVKLTFQKIGSCFSAAGKTKKANLPNRS